MNVRILSIRQPWAALIARGTKRIENRTWTTPYRGAIAIHASATFDRHAFNNYRDVISDAMEQTEPRGAIIAVVDLIAIVQSGDPLHYDLIHPDDRKFAIGPYCWILRRPRRIQPITTPGRQGLYRPTPTELDAIKQRLAERTYDPDYPYTADANLLP